MPYTCYDYYPEDINKALRRSQAWYRRSKETNTFTIYSRNRVFPLTDDEKRKIEEFLNNKKEFPYKIIWGRCD